MQRRSSQLLTQLMQLRKESLKKSGLPGFEPWPLIHRCSALTDRANKPTGSWSLDWFVIYPGTMKMKLWMYKVHIFEMRNEEINVQKILAVMLRELCRFIIQHFYTTQQRHILCRPPPTLGGGVTGAKYSCTLSSGRWACKQKITTWTLLQWH